MLPSAAGESASSELTLSLLDIYALGHLYTNDAMRLREALSRDISKLSALGSQTGRVPGRSEQFSGRQLGVSNMLNVSK